MSASHNFQNESSFLSRHFPLPLLGLAASFLKCRPWCPFLQFIASGQEGPLGLPRPESGFRRQRKGAPRGGTPPAGEASIRQGGLSVVFLPKQGAVIKKEPLANVGTASPTFFLILQCVCADAFLM